MKIGMMSFAHMHAASYANCLKQIGGVEIVGIFDEDKGRGESMAKNFGAKYYPNYDNLLKLKLDAVIVCSANADHKEHVIAAAEAGCKHIVGQRLKQSGRRWALEGLRSILSLRLAVLNGQSPSANRCAA